MRLSDKRSFSRKKLDSRLAQVSVNHSARPPRGWIKAIRESLGMTSAQLARRMGISQPSVVALEESEDRQGIRLSSLQRAASALNCKVVYAFVPNEPLEKMVEERVKRLATVQLSIVERSMALENQSVTDTEVNESHLNSIISKIDMRKIWDD